jgi:hypothetical protein
VGLREADQDAEEVAAQPAHERERRHPLQYKHEQGVSRTILRREISIVAIDERGNSPPGVYANVECSITCNSAKSTGYIKLMYRPRPLNRGNIIGMMLELTLPSMNNN